MRGCVIVVEHGRWKNKRPKRRATGARATEAGKLLPVATLVPLAIKDLKTFALGTYILSEFKQYVFQITILIHEVLQKKGF